MAASTASSLNEATVAVCAGRSSRIQNEQICSVFRQKDIADAFAPDSQRHQCAQIIPVSECSVSPQGLRKQTYGGQRLLRPIFTEKAQNPPFGIRIAAVESISLKAQPRKSGAGQFLLAIA